ncbi:unnamed protein product [Paramecium sonneborni]|uniref:Uncharacterized protein n=1 Tax=Paramecium sonneborni TaxID=65129 RepID=A0A8S1MUF7_9CILI|nr:unnamed protein product [Paramecium sonneborni]
MKQDSIQLNHGMKAEIVEIKYEFLLNYKVNQFSPEQRQQYFAYINLQLKQQQTMSSITLLNTDQQLRSEEEIEKSDIIIEDAVKIHWNIWCGSWQFIKTSIIIKNNKNQELIYIKDHKTLRQEKIFYLRNNFEFMKNVEQINHLTWIGLFSNLNQKIGIWNAYWKLQKIIIGGYYDQCSKKQGKWVEIFENYCDFAKVTYKGQYKNGLKCNIWETLYQNKIMQYQFNEVVQEYMVNKVKKMVYGQICMIIFMMNVKLPFKEIIKMELNKDHGQQNIRNTMNKNLIRQEVDYIMKKG